MQTRSRHAAVWAFFLLSLGAAGCTGFLPRTAPSSFYVLHEVRHAPPSAPLPIALGVGPVQLPAYLDRPEIATRASATEIKYAATHRWASNLQPAVTSVLMINLGNRIGSDRITAFPFELGLPRDYDVTVDFFRFEPTATGQILIEGLWRIRDSRTGEERVVRRMDLSRGAPPGDYAAAVGALSDALAELADDVAGALRDLHARR